jgi:nucleoside 2-deoxyribosyltransferase
MKRDFRGKEQSPKVVQFIVEGDKQDIARADVVLVYFDQASVGTSMEVHYAWLLRKPVVVVNVSGKPLSPWLVYHSTAQVLTLETAVRILNDWSAASELNKYVPDLR